MDLYKDLPDLNYSVEIDMKGEFTKLPYKGEFSCKIPNLGDRADSDKRRALLNAGLDVTLRQDVLEFHNKIAYLGVVIEKAPDWWVDSKDGLHLLDGNVVSAIYDKVSEYEDDWMKKVSGDYQEPEEKSNEKAE